RSAQSAGPSTGSRGSCARSATRTRWSGSTCPRRGNRLSSPGGGGGAPIQFEKDVPFVTGLVKLAGTEILLTARIDGAKYEALKIGDKVRLKVIELPDKRDWFRFPP